MAKKKKRGSPVLRFAGKTLLLGLKIPYYIGKGIVKGTRKSSQAVNQANIQIRRRSIKANYENFEIIKTIDGKYTDWEEKIATSDSRIGIILGSRGSGKTAIGIKLLENLKTKSKKKSFAIGFKKEELPSWIKVVENISSVENNSFILIDEGGVLFNSRSSMSSANKLLSSLMLVARHKNLSILFISQNSSNLEVNILRQADFLILKPSSLLQKEFERKIIQKIYEKTKKDFRILKKHKGLTYIYSDSFRGFVNNPLPSFWKESISKSFK